MSNDPAKKGEPDDRDEVVDDLLDAVEDDDTDPVKDPVEAPEEPKARQPYKSHFARRQEKLASVTPLHEAPKRGRGRPKKVDKKPTREDLEYHAEIMKQQASFIDDDEVVRSARAGSESTIHTLKLVKERIAIQAAALEFHRLELQKRGVSNREIPQIISRQIAAMKEIASVEMEIRKLGVEGIDLKNERLQKVFSLLIDTFRDVAHEVLSAEQFDLVWNKLETELEGWEERADSVLR